MALQEPCPQFQSKRKRMKRSIRDRPYPAVADAQQQSNGCVASGILASIVVPTCGRPHLLNNCLISLLFQYFAPSRYEIIVVDDRPNAATRGVVTEWATLAAADGLSITYIASTGPHGPAAARNRGWRAARGAIIAFTDDDTLASPDWLQNGVGAFEKDVLAVWGRIVMPLSTLPTDYEKDAKNLERAEFVTANCFCRKQVLEELCGFDERFRFAWREDADLYFRLLGHPGRIIHMPSAVVTHPIRAAPWGVSLQQQKKIQSDALLYKKHPALYRTKIRATPRWDYYLTVAALLVCIAAAGFGNPGVAASAASFWLALTARFCLLRLRSTVKTPAHIAEMIVTSALIPPLAVFWRMIGAVKFRVRFV
jgi:cellulose synthase/poly-beta-1,6-N-acetylglucosamine synthase-like glycosyltransferase